MDNWMDQAVQEFAFPSFTLITHRGSRKGLSCLKLPAVLLSINCLSMWSVFRGYWEGLLHFNNQRLCQWQLLWLFWNSELGVSGAHIDSKCDSSCHCGIPVLMIGQLIEWSVSRTLWAVYQVAGPLLIGATFAVTWDKQVMRIIQLSFGTPSWTSIHYHYNSVLLFKTFWFTILCLVLFFPAFVFYPTMLTPCCSSLTRCSC